MSRHPSSPTPTVQRALVALATAGVALGAGAVTASAATDPVPDVMRARPAGLGEVEPQAGLQALTGTVGHVTGPVSAVKPNPLAGTGVDPLDNGVATQVGDVRPPASQELTGPVAQARSIGGIPVLGRAASLLNH